MKGAVVALFCAGVGLLAGDALADSIPVPTVPSVTVPTPAAPVRLPAVPKLPAPALPSTPKASAPPGTTFSAPIQFSALGATTSSGGSTDASSSSPSGSSSRNANQPRVKHFHGSRTWIGTSGKKGRRTTTLTFVLSRPATVVFTVQRLSPDCRTVGHFTVRGHAGLNRVRFAGRVDRRQLSAGTYRITARTGDGGSVQRVTVVVIDGSAPTREELASLRASNTCSGTDGIASTAANSTGGSNTGALSEPVDRSLSPREQPSASGPTNSDSGGVLGSAAIQKTARAIRPALVALLAAAILLLGLASLPRVAVDDPRLNEALARHRTEIAGVGAAALVAVAITFLLG